MTSQSVMHRHLDPATSLAEILFGLIMTLTFTLGAGIIIQDEGREGARELLIAVIGCNIAWGIIDGALYIVGQLFDRGRLRRLGNSIRAATPEAAVTMVAGELDELLADITNEKERNVLYGRIADNVRARTKAVPNPVTRDDLLGGFWSFWLVVLASVPAALPFLVIDEARLALRISNGILLALLFITGFLWARYTTGKPWIVGFSMLIGGFILVAAAIALGGRSEERRVGQAWRSWWV